MKKKLFRAVLSMAAALLIAVSALPRTAYAAGASLSGSSSVQPGNSVTLTLSVDSKIYGLTADLNCGEGLTFTNYSCSVSGWSILVNQNRFSVYGTNSASGGVITVTLKVASGAQPGAALSAKFENIVASDGEKDLELGTASWSGSVGAAPSDNCSLSAIMCGNATLSPAFSSGTTYYTAKVPYSVSKLSLDYNRADKGQKVSISGTELAVGVNTVTLKVTAANGTTGLYDTDLKGAAAIVIGSEGDGMTRLAAENCDFLVSIPMKGDLNSLNASASAAILLYEAVRQRMN